MTIGELKQNLSSYSDDIPCAYMLWMPEDVFDISGDWALGPVSKQRPNTHQMPIKEPISVSVFLGRSQNLAF